jgi:hypothetical protein
MDPDLEKVSFLRHALQHRKVWSLEKATIISIYVYNKAEKYTENQ